MRLVVHAAFPSLAAAPLPALASVPARGCASAAPRDRDVRPRADAITQPNPDDNPPPRPRARAASSRAAEKNQPGDDLTSNGGRGAPNALSHRASTAATARGNAGGLVKVRPAVNLV